MVTSQIRDTIEQAVLHEQRSGALREEFARHLPQLRERLVLPDEAPVDALLDFVTRYIRSVPACLRLVTALSKRQGFFEYAAPLLHLAEDYFLHPPEALAHEQGLRALLDEAFLAHRLLEEVNDHHIRHLQRPLLPQDMTEANIIVHYLLGDAFAGRLEALVEFTAGQLLDREHLWEGVRAAARSDVAGAGTEAALSAPGREIRLKLAE